MPSPYTANTSIATPLQDINFTKETLNALTEQMQQIKQPENIPATETSKSQKTVTTRGIVATMAYLAGIKEQVLQEQYEKDNEELFESLRKHSDANLIRTLCMVRSQIMRHYDSVDQSLRYDMTNLDRNRHFTEVDFKSLQDMGFQVIRVNYTAEKYLTDITKLINQNICRVQKLFPEWIKWEYVKSLFFIKNGEKADVIRSERKLFTSNINYYPFGTYLHWQPSDNGNILYNDGKFLTILYEQHGDRFGDKSKYTDAGDGTKNNIYDFIDRAKKVVMVVDCENSDLFKLYSVLRGLDEEKVSKIEKIVLYDDEHTTEAWDWLEQFVPNAIPVEHIEVERLVNRKSLVDMRIAVGVCRGYYEEQVDSVILVSSDSDYWGLITSMPQVNYLVMYEYDKCGAAIRNALQEHAIYYCPIDDFCTWDVPTVQKLILFRALEMQLPYIIGRNPMEVTQELYAKTRITTTMNDMARFCDKYVKTLRLKIMEDGTLGLEIQK